MVLAGFGGEEAVVDGLLRRMKGRLPDARDFALRNRVLLVESRLGVPVDVSLAAISFEERVLARSSAWEVASATTLVTCGAEDLIVLKAFAGRNKDWLDIEGIALRQSGKLDEDLIQREIEPLLDLKEDPVTKARLFQLLHDARV